MTGLSLRPTLATIAPNIPFLDSLAAWWLNRTRTSPLAVSDGIFIVPTRRAARGLADAFLRQASGQPLLLPRILPLGGLDETPLALAGALNVPPAVPENLRLGVLTRFILAMGGRNGAPAEADRAWALAVELARLLDDAARAEIDLAAELPKAVHEDFAAHWNITLDFLRIVTHAWPEWLAVQGVQDVVVRQRALLDAQIAAWRADPPAHPVIAAGSTGAIPAVGRLLKLVAHLPQGMVVLPGLDLELDEASWDALDDGHPQASLRHLLSLLDARRGDVRNWPDIADTGLEETAPAGRIVLWRQALLPATSLAAWQNPDAFDDTGLTRLDAADQQEEALSIALALRDALETPGTRAALVTPDRQLARRVAAELLRFGIVADDSAGEDLAETPPAVFLRLLAAAFAETLRPVPLLALLKHPFCALGLSPAACRMAARRLEWSALRGPRPAPGIAGLRTPRAPSDLLDRLEQALAPLLGIDAADRISPAELVSALIGSAEALAASDSLPGAQILWAGEEGAVLATHLASLQEALELLPPQKPVTLPGLLESTLAGIAVRSRRALRGREGTEHPRVFIWGLLEARLQSAELMVLGGLSEGVWPPLGDSGPWMNRAMRKAIGLPSPEEQLGLAAHDLVMASCAAPSAILSAPRRRDRAPAVPSRWLVRLEALLSGQKRALRPHPAPAWSRVLDRPEGAAKQVPPPAPAPPVEKRPRRLSVTEIETFLRDPYAIYAKHVLRLKKLAPLEESADAADYGAIVHLGLHRFFQRNGTAWPANAGEQLAVDMDAVLQEAGMRPALACWWRPRLQRIAAWVAEAELDRRKRGTPRKLQSEVVGSWTFPAPAGNFELHGRADRIECRADGAYAILDYKTGAPPTGAQVEAGLAPQLPLEAAMLQAGAFGADLAGDISELTYWHISGGFEPGKILPLFKADPARTAAVSQEAATSLQALVAEFDNPARAYLSQPSPGAAPRFSDYAMLARVAEWAAVDESEG
jgi:ATP-dependent helicase/nuclease subunit B